MKQYILKRFLQILPVLFLASIVSFCIIRFSPGDPLLIYKTPGMTQVEMTPEAIAALEESLGLHGSIVDQYIAWAKNMLQGNWGNSVINFNPVKPQIMERLPATIGLMGVSLILSILISIPLGLFSGYKPGKFVDHISSLISYIGISIPPFWFGILLVIIFSLRLKLLPSSGMRTIGESGLWDLVKHAIMPSIVLAFGNIGVFTRYIKANTAKQLKEDYVLTALSIGLENRTILFQNVLKNCLLPVITVIGMNFGSLVSGSFIVEFVFGWPGLGNLGMSAINTRDYPMIMAITMLSCLILLVGNFLADIFYCIADPRIKNSGMKLRE